VEELSSDTEYFDEPLVTATFSNDYIIALFDISVNPIYPHHVIELAS
jgi:hypothetical protein